MEPFSTHHKLWGNSVYIFLFYFIFPPRKTDQTIKCIMPPALEADAELVTVCVEFEDHPCEEANISTMYTYEQNPTISSIHPTKSFLRWVNSQKNCKWILGKFLVAAM